MSWTLRLPLVVALYCLLKTHSNCKIRYTGRLLDERDFQPPPLAEGESDAGFSQMPFDTQLPTQASTQANLLPRFGAVSASLSGIPL